MGVNPHFYLTENLTKEFLFITDPKKFINLIT